jgi:hypothetical protein
VTQSSASTTATTTRGDESVSDLVASSRFARLARRGGGGSSSSAGRVGTIALMVVSLIVAGITRQIAVGFQESHSPTARHTTASSGSLAGMDSYALALLLGGLRGPLVMILWSSSESQKIDRDLEGIDTKIEWIRRLQPEFDPVHIFQIWNKAYNLSVQMVGLSNKYTTILDAVDYGRNVDAERPDNLNIIKEIGRIYSEKLGSAIPERTYFRERVRRETRHREQRAGAAQRNQPGFQRLAHEPMLDARGNILPQFLQVKFPINPAAPAIEQYDGSDLQFLKRYEPFPYGISPLALGYNYHKRGQVLLATRKQLWTHLTDSVIDSQPAIVLKLWAEEELERGRRLEAKAFGAKLPPERIDQELATADITLDTPVADEAVLGELLHCYSRCADVSRDAAVEYERHLSKPEFITKRTMYASHIDTVLTYGSMAAGDRDFLLARQASGDERTKLLDSASRHYHDAIRHSGLTALRYFTSDELAEAVMPKGVTRTNIGTGGVGEITSAVTEEDILRMLSAIRAIVDARNDPEDANSKEDRLEFENYINRALRRLAQTQPR